MEDKIITITPRMFLSKPFIACPKCGKKEFGVLMINSYNYVRRCAECRHDESYPLPALSRKVIYIDQFAISDMMKSINPHLGKMNKVDPFFKILFEKLDKLNKLQLIICPDSQSHFNESLASPFYKALKRLYEQLSHGTTFYDPDTIKRFEITNNFFGWIGDKKEPLDIGDILMGDNLDGWQDRLIISVSLRDQDPQLAGDIRKERDTSSKELEKIFNRWQTESKKTFNDWYEEEANSFGKSIFENYIRGLLDYEALSTGKIPVNMSTISSFLSESSVTITYIHSKLREKGFDDEKVLKTSLKYFNSEKLKDLPYVKLSSALFASLAREAAQGRKKLPTKGMMNDIEAIASYAPFCDALFIDNECRKFLSNKDTKDKYDISKKVFSRDNKEEFINYLDAIEKSASKAHLNLVKEVYGEDWGKPYVEMFENVT